MFNRKVVAPYPPSIHNENFDNNNNNINNDIANDIFFDEKSSLLYNDNNTGNIDNNNNDDDDNNENYPQEFNEKVTFSSDIDVTNSANSSVRSSNTDKSQLKRKASSLFKLTLKRSNSYWSTMPNLDNITVTRPQSPIANSAQLWKQDLDPNDKAQMKASEIHRQVIIHEIIRTEDEYVKDLRYFLENHEPKIRKSGVKLPRNLEKIFMILPQIFLLHLNTSLHLLCIQALMRPIIPSISGVLSELSKELEVYESYLIHHETAIAELTNARRKNDKLGKILNHLDRQELPTGKYMSVESLLAKPFQRLCKYPLLVMTLLKATEQSHEDFTSLNDLYEQIDCAIKELQERKIAYEQTKENEEFTRKFRTLRPLKKMYSSTFFVFHDKKNNDNLFRKHMN